MGESGAHDAGVKKLDRRWINENGKKVCTQKIGKESEGEKALQEKETVQLKWYHV